MSIDRDLEGRSGQGDEYSSPENNEPSYEPECSASEEEIEELGIECEFENKDGSWWCTTHNCWA